jgi:periplasmic divalent cation tolerance protein
VTAEPSSFAVVLITAADREQALRIAGALVEERLVACVNVVDPITSVYRWEGKINEDREALLIAKTRLGLADRVAARVRELHSYSCPETIAFPLAAGAPAYLAWLAAETGPA